MSLIGSPKTLHNCIAELEKWDIIEVIRWGKNDWTGPTKVRISGSFMNRHNTTAVPQANNSSTTGKPQDDTTKTSKTDKTNKTKNDDADASELVDLFDQFWDAYDKKKDTKKCRAKFDKLSPEVQRAIFKHGLFDAAVF